MAAPSSSTGPKQSIFAREFYCTAGLMDSLTTTQPTNQKSAEMSHDPVSGSTLLHCSCSNHRSCSKHELEAGHSLECITDARHVANYNLLT